MPGGRVHGPDVAGTEPAVRGEGGFGGGRVLPVAGEDLRSPELDLAVGHPGQDAGQRHPHRVTVRVVHGITDVQAGLGRAVPDQRDSPQGRSHPLRERGVQRGRPGGGHEGLVDGGHAEQYGGPTLPDRPHQVGGGEAGPDVHRAARDQRGVQAAEAVRVIQRQRVRQHVVRAPAPGRHRRSDRDGQLSVGERHTLGPARGARGVGEQRDVARVGRDLAGRPARDIAVPDVDGRQRAEPGQQPARPGIGEGQCGLGVGDQVLQLARLVTRIGQHHHRAGFSAPAPRPPG
jgi:hypothetical protein